MQIIATPHGHVQKHGNGPVSVVLAHGSGIGMEHEFMQTMAAALVAQNFSVYLFEFAYMQQIQKTGIKRPPPPVARLELEYECESCGIQRQVLPSQVFYHSKLLLGGASGGGAGIAARQV